MAIRTKGTQLYVIDPDDFSVLTVGCVTQISGISSPREQIDTTCLESEERTFLPGLKSPGAASFTIQADPADASHIRLHEMFADSTITNLDWALGWGDGTTDPTEDSTAFIRPSSRSWLLFSGYISDFPFDFGINAAVTSTISLQLSGEIVWEPKD